jgi:leader peptidase (prepilin peptidase)/N-methyltransferase
MVVTVLFVFGLIIGSFLNVIIYRLPRGESIVLPPPIAPTANTGWGRWI